MGFGDKSKKDKAAEKSAAASAKDDAAREDASWAENDKGAKKKLDRAAVAADKEAEAIRKRQEKKELEEAENAADNATAEKAAAKKAKQTSGKLTQAQIQRNLALLNAAPGNAKQVKTKKTTTVDAPAIEPNMNRGDDIVATSVEDALKQLEIDPKAGTKVSFKQFESEMTDQVREENPGLKQSQVKEKVYKLWERSPLNPKNAPQS